MLAGGYWGMMTFAQRFDGALGCRLGAVHDEHLRFTRLGAAPDDAGPPRARPRPPLSCASRAPPRAGWTRQLVEAYPPLSTENSTDGFMRR